jgi:outer membrane protein OmpA-like peptidoglycan-associated protein
LVADYAYRPLVVRDTMDGPGTAIVSHLLNLHLQVGVGFLDRINVHLNLPIQLLQTGDTMARGLSSFGSVALGDPRLGARVRILGHADRDAFSLHAGASFFFNSGVFGVPANANVTDNRFRGKFDLILAGRVSLLRWSFNPGFHYRDTTASFNGTQSSDAHEIFARAGLGVVLMNDRLQLGAEAFASAAISHFFTFPWTNLEVMASGHYLIADMIKVGAAVGPGITQGIGTPALRALLMVQYAPVRRPVVVEAPRDTDSDGVMDPDDQCVDVPQGDHPDPARRGCPQGDRDHDGVMDPDDQCVDVPQGDHPDPARRGCPLNDTDHDGIYDNADQCVDVPQGEYPDPTRPGCPDGDADGDGVLNGRDQCRDVIAGAHPDPARPGCPLPDRDGDTVIDAQDHCPDQPGAPNPDPQRNGCPGLVRVQNGMLQIMAPVFFATNRDVILPRSFPVLTAVGEALRASPDIRRISVEGHTDDVGDDARNMDLSQRRSQSVVRWLSEHQVEPARLEAHGMGETRPMRPIDGLRGRDLRTARSLNRRVEFRITDPAPTTPAAR